MTFHQQLSVSFILLLLFLGLGSVTYVRMSKIDVRGELVSMGVIAKRGVIQHNDRLVIIPPRKPYIPADAE